MVIPTHNVLLTIENTDPKCYWLTNHVETLLMKLWHTITVSTNSFYCKRELVKSLQKTNGNSDGIGFKLHDFGYRGVSSEESAALGSAAHLVSFIGTDSIVGIEFLKKYYGGGMTGYSVLATEHSVACSFGKENEEDYFLNIVKNNPNGIVSIVSDTYDVYNFVKTMCEKHKDLILSRNGTVVFRPDSGDPIQVNLTLMNILWQIFGGTEYNGYKLLPPQVRLIQGDGIDFDMIKSFLFEMEDCGWSTDNFVFGSGGGLLQKFDRDTQKFAIKASYIEKNIDGKIVGESIVKNPVTMTSKKSKPGKLILINDDGFKTISSEDIDYNKYVNVNLLETVFENGEIKRYQTIEEIRTIANSFI
jgi:nicotinamide phosphoribosyltransferase